ncbi:MAG: VCBS repeat-containing protein [Planctomycetaceae bacterium]|nr:VCBS repeat-containing protein [Planctomycetaceae bacterium]
MRTVVSEWILTCRQALPFSPKSRHKARYGHQIGICECCETRQLLTLNPGTLFVSQEATVTQDGDIQLGNEGILGRDLANDRWTLTYFDGSMMQSVQIGAWNRANIYHYVNTGDFNGDGRLDLFAVDQLGNLTVSLIDQNIVEGTSQISEQIFGKWSTSVQWADVRVGDYNGDGYTDVAARNSSTGRWIVARNQQGSSFEIAVAGAWSINHTWLDVQTGDFNGDGFDDLIGRSQSTGAWLIAESDGNLSPSFHSHILTTWSSKADWQNVTVLDVNRDGIDDLLARNSSANTWWLLTIQEGTAVTSRAARFSTEIAWSDWIVLDDPANDVPAIAARNSQTGWWAQVSASPDLFRQLQMTRWSDKVAWTNILTMDVDGDGRQDLLGRNPATGAWIASDLTMAVDTQNLAVYLESTPKVIFRWSPSTRWFNVGNLNQFATGDKVPGYHESIIQVENDPTLPSVLILGDSISIGYTLPVRAGVAGIANIHRPSDNCRSTEYALEHLDEWLALLGQNHQWDVIYFNFGLHDMVYVDDEGIGVSPEEGEVRTSLEVYRQNLIEITNRLKEVEGATLIWANTTPIPEGSINRIPADVDAYNNVAAEVMNTQEIIIHDLNSFVANHEFDLQIPEDVHFTQYGSLELGDEVLRTLRTLF